MSTKRDALEARIQQDMYLWYNNTYCLPQHYPHRCIIWHVANENQQRLMSIGLLPGVADLTLIHTTPHAKHSQHIYIEVKRPTGKQSPTQVDFMRRVQALGYEYHIARSREEFIAIIHAIEQRMTLGV